MYAGKGECSARPAIVACAFNARCCPRIGRFCNRFRIPADPGVDVGIVHRRRADPDQDIAHFGKGHGDIGSPFELVITAIAGKQNGTHDSGQGHSARASPNWFRYHFWNLMTLPS